MRHCSTQYASYTVYVHKVLKVLNNKFTDIEKFRSGNFTCWLIKKQKEKNFNFNRTVHLLIIIHSRLTPHYDVVFKRTISNALGRYFKFIVHHEIVLFLILFESTAPTVCDRYLQAEHPNTISKYHQCCGRHRVMIFCFIFVRTRKKNIERVWLGRLPKLNNKSIYERIL